MLKHTNLEVSGWHDAWLERTLPAFRLYTHITSYTLSLAVLTLGLLGYFGIRRSLRQLKNCENNADARATIYKKINKRVRKVCRGHFYVANVYLLNVLLIALVDAYIGAVSIHQNVNEHPEAWSSDFVIRLVAFCLYLIVLFSSALFLAPFVQMVAITWVLARFARKRGVDTLADYIPEATFYSTHIAQLWSMVCFFIIAWWAPIHEGSAMTRMLILQACIGSAVAWLDASFVFNFCARKLADKDLNISTGMNILTSCDLLDQKPLHLTIECALIH